ncbi:MAG: DUF2029 domain-containing protein [Anaerolineae bacterium]|nr:DUF2029 domain-containing protein [Anaerolineae bacterium]
MNSSAGRSSRYSKTVDFLLILILFLTSRLMLLLAFPTDSLMAYGDYQHYFNVAGLSQTGGCAFATGASDPCFPYLDYWYEFPPIFAYLNIGVFYLAGGQLKNYVVLLAFVLLVAEVGNLILLYRLAGILHGPVRAVNIAWIYTALFVPIFFWLGNFDALTTFFILLALYALMQNRSKWLALALGLGTMVKFLPAVLLATVWRLKGLKAMLGYAAATVLISLVIFAPFALINPEQTLASLRAQAGKSSYQTVWAIIDGNDTTGNFGPLIDHFDSTKAGQPVNNPARLPTWLTLIPFGLLGVFVFIRPQTLTDPNLDAVIFTTLTFVIFFLWSQGWSPQWQTFLIPLLLLSFREKQAVLFIIVLGFINFLEWPVMLSRGLTQLLPITIAVRTLVLILLGVELYQKLTASKEVAP